MRREEKNYLFLGKKLSRRQAIGTVGKIATSAVIAGVVAGIGGYLVGSSAAPVRTVEKTVTQTKGVQTVTTTLPASTVTQYVTKTTTVGAATPARYGGVIKVCQEGEPTMLDPHKSTFFVDWWIENHIYEGLLRLSPYLEIEPALAWYWEQPDPTTIIFYLRKNVKFHNGKPMTSADVKYSFERVMNPATGSPTKAYLDVISSIETPDDYTVKLILSEPSAPLLFKIAECNGLRVAIVPEGAGDELATKPVGTGPFKLKEWAKGDHITLERFNEYWDVGFPYADELTFYFQSDPEAMLTMLRTGTVDFAEPIYYKYAKEVTSKDLYSVVNRITGFHFLLLNTKADSPFKDKRVRQAVAHAINREEIIKLAFFGYATPIDHPLLPGTPWYVSVPSLSYDLDRARELLAEAGYPDGFEDEIVAAPTPEERKIAEVVASQLLKIGIKLDVKTPEIGAYLDEVVKKRTYHIADCGWTPPTEPDIILSSFFHSKGWINWTGYSDPEVDSLLEEGRKELDPVKRKVIYAEVLRKALPEASIIFIEQCTRIQAWWRHLRGYIPRPDLTKLFHNVWKEKR